MNLVLWYFNWIKSEPRTSILKLVTKSEPWDMIVPRKTKWIMDNESIKLWDECTCWKDNNMIAHKCTERRNQKESKHIFLSEPSQVNKPIPQEWTCPTMIQSWCLSEPWVCRIKTVIMSEPDYEDYYKLPKWTLQINKSMAWSVPNAWNNHATGVNLKRWN